MKFWKVVLTYVTILNDVKNVSNVSFFHHVCKSNSEETPFNSNNLLEQFIRYLPSLFKYLSPSYILTNLFSPLFDLLLSSIDNDQHAKVFCAKCGAIADERFVSMNNQEFLINFMFIVVNHLLRINIERIYWTIHCGNRRK